VNAWTTRFRIVAWALFAVTDLTALAGWVLGHDPTLLSDQMMWCAIATGIGESSNVGKRATYKKEAALLQDGEVGS
jgi:hypothetical protein